MTIDLPGTTSTNTKMGVSFTLVYIPLLKFMYFEHEKSVLCLKCIILLC